MCSSDDLLWHACNSLLRFFSRIMISLALLSSSALLIVSTGFSQYVSNSSHISFQWGWSVGLLATSLEHFWCDPSFISSTQITVQTPGLFLSLIREKASRYAWLPYNVRQKIDDLIAITASSTTVCSTAEVSQLLHTTAVGYDCGLITIEVKWELAYSPDYY